jgi:steroid delta-isomerase-like uncharacterized protein
MTDTQAVQTTTDLDPVWVEDFAKRWLDAWNSHEPERLLELMTEDIVYDDSAWPETMRGHADVRAFLDWAWGGMPDLTFEVVDGPFLRPGRPQAAFYWKGTGTFSGQLDPPGFAPTGARLEFVGADFQEYRDGRVARLRIVLDMMDVSRQMGLMPKAGSGIEKAGAAAQRLVMEVQERFKR